MLCCNCYGYTGFVVIDVSQDRPSEHEQDKHAGNAIVQIEMPDSESNTPTSASGPHRNSAEVGAAAVLLPLQQRSKVWC